MDGEPNVVPVAFKDVTPEGKLVVGDVFLDTTLKNIAANHGKIAVSVYDAQSLEGYQVKGTARYITEGAVVNTFKAMVEKMFNGATTGDNAAKALPYKRKKCDIKDMLKEGDVLTLYIKDEFFEESEQENYEFLKAPDKLDIVYEDENIILIDKKPGKQDR